MIFLINYEIGGFFIGKGGGGVFFALPLDEDCVQLDALVNLTH